MLETRIEAGIRPCALEPRQVEREFRALVEAGARIRPAGRAKARPGSLLSQGYVPRHKLRLFDTVFYLARLRQEPNARFFVAYVLLEADRDRVEWSPGLLAEILDLLGPGSVRAALTTASRPRSSESGRRTARDAAVAAG